MSNGSRKARRIRRRSTPSQARAAVASRRAPPDAGFFVGVDLGFEPAGCATVIVAIANGVQEVSETPG